MHSIVKLSGTVVLLAAISSCSSPNSENRDSPSQYRLGTFTYSYTISSSSETIALSNDPAPQTSNTFSNFEDAALNDSGQIVFYALANEPSSIVDPSGLWFRASDGSMSLVAMQGSTVLNSAGLLFADINKQFQLNNSGQVLFASSIAGPGVSASNNFALFFRDSDGSILPVARSGDIAPGWTTSPPFQGFSPYRDLNDLGEVIFIAEVNLGPDSSVDGDLIVPGIWTRKSDGVLAAAVLYGDDAPGTGETFVNFANTQINNNSFAVFEGRAGFNWRHGVWAIAADGSVVKIVYEGDPAPGINGISLGKASTYATPLIKSASNDNDEIVLFSIIEGNGVSQDNDHAIWFRDASGIFQTVIREGDHAPQLSADIVITALMGSDGEITYTSPKLNNQGQVLFSGQLSGTTIDASNDSAIWLWDPNSGNQKVIQSGDTVTGMGIGETVASFSLNGEGMQLNDNGEVLIEVTLTGATVTTGNDQALIYYNSTSGANVFLREGDAMQVGVGDNRTVSDYLLEARPGINNSSQILFAAGFSTSSGLFLTTPQLSPPTPIPPDSGTGCTPHKEDESESDESEDDFEYEYDDDGLEIDLKHENEDIDDNEEHELSSSHHDDETCEVEDEHHGESEQDDDHKHKDDDSLNHS